MDHINQSPMKGWSWEITVPRTEGNRQIQGWLGNCFVLIPTAWEGNRAVQIPSPLAGESLVRPSHQHVGTNYIHVRSMQHDLDCHIWDSESLGPRTKDQQPSRPQFVNGSTHKCRRLWLYDASIRHVHGQVRSNNLRRSKPLAPGANNGPSYIFVRSTRHSIDDHDRRVLHGCGWCVS